MAKYKNMLEREAEARQARKAERAERMKKKGTKVKNDKLNDNPTMKYDYDEQYEINNFVEDESLSVSKVFKVKLNLL